MIPNRGASWDEVGPFAATFNAHLYCEEPWEHSDWSQGIPIAEYEEMIRRNSQPAPRYSECLWRVPQAHEQFGTLQGTLSELRTYLHLNWRGYLHTRIE